MARRDSTGRGGAPKRPRRTPTRPRKATAPARRGSSGPGLFERVLRFLLFGLIVRVLWWLGLRTAVIGGIILGGATLWAYAQLPEAEALLDGRERGSVTLLDREGNTFAWRGQQYVTTRAETASPHLVNAVIATEDRRFHDHFGLDPIGIARAMAANLRAGRVVQGGSTITQQVAKLLFFENTRSLERHIKQVPYVLAMEAKYTKEEILSIYLNRAYLGAGAQGFEAAAQRYFGKSARNVTPAEAAMLAGLLKAPSRYAPTSDIEAAQGRAEVIIGLMEEQGYLSRVDAELARALPAQLSDAASARAGGYFADWVMSAGPSFLTNQTSEDVVLRTTFDPRLQRAAETALAEIFSTKVREGSKAQAAIVVMSPDGAVRAMVGGRNTGAAQAGQFNRATQALRQPGSAFKPFVYAAGLMAGMHPLDMVVDSPITLNVPGSGPWSPQNYTREYLGEITLTEAFRESINTVAVKVSEQVGRTRVRAIAQDLGIERPLADGPSLALGVSEATLLELTGAYAGILNQGQRSMPYGVIDLRLKGDNTVLMGTDRQAPIPVLDPEAAGMLVYMMSEVIANGTGQRAQLPDRPAAGKTGTTQAARDAWFIGFTGDYVAGVWMGYDDNTPLSGVTGGGLPAEIWRETMLRVHEGLPPTPLPMVVPEVPGTRLPDMGDDPVAGNILQQVIGGIFGASGLY
ncbi:PBP1A family penicillin-binding protein [Halovulum dunhuangense]|uniref:PBP1A family penicillin-binding protein n=1 Tax=Halovulum dunhuangense TaxID=1505036 RepID=A0A849L5I7_9RHOB|nr:PBP1A family penicillin-binding protein [Halovulum dunhuangense]NNU81639.1 PBP1A family penicillin-binding protein [Halovulum dunhuangense]